MAFVIDDMLVVPGQGIGKVTKVGELEGFSGLFITVENPSWTTSKPASRVVIDGWRHLSSPDQLKEAFAELVKKRRPIPGKHGHKKVQTIENWLQEGSVYSLATCVRDLYVPRDEEIPETFRVVYDKAMIRLAEEAALVLKRPVMGMRGLIESTVINRKIPEGLFL